MSNKEPPEAKSCFFITPIGDPESTARRRSDMVLKHILTPTAKNNGFKEVVRADMINQSGIINKQIIERIIHDDLVIADLSDCNPNVMYELAIRHVVAKPLIHIIQKNSVLPFDLNQQRMIFYDMTDPDNIEDCRNKITDQINEITVKPDNIDNPIKYAIEMMDVQKKLSKNELDSVNIIESINNDISQKLSRFDSLLRNLDRFEFLLRNLEKVFYNFKYQEKYIHFDPSDLQSGSMCTGDVVKKITKIRCKSCGTRVYLDVGQQIPPCPKCDQTEFWLISE